jgi:trigger factor
VRPKAELGDYKGIEVGRAAPEVSDTAIDEEVERLRERSGRLETVDRPAARTDFVVMDFVGSIDGTPFPGGEGRDQMVELGSGRLVPGFEEQLEGSSAGEERTVTVTFPEEYGAEELAGKEAQFAVKVKEVKAKDLPELDDELAAEAGFDTLDELREDIRTRMSEAQAGQIEAEFREAALDSAVAAASVEVPESLVEARARERLEEVVHQLGHQGISREMLFRMRPEEDMIEESKPESEQALRREAVLAAIVEAEKIEPTEDEVMEAVTDAAQGTSPKKLLERLKSAGRLDALKADLAQRKALDLVAESAKPISVEQAQARDKLWTPEREEASAGSGGQLWTPGS